MLIYPGQMVILKDQDLIRLSSKTRKINDRVETFTIQFSDMKPTETTIDLVWENTKVSFSVAVNVDEKVMKNIESVMLSDKRPYHQAASYYYENKKDLKQALEWVNKAIENNPTAYWSILLKARIQLELNDKKGALATAEIVKKMAKENENSAYVKFAEEVIEKASKK
jgi:tetratricopeptide (TPR) repeat protein